MAELQTVPTKASVPAFIETVEHEGRRADAKALVKLMQSICAEKPTMWGPAIIGFGKKTYKYSSGKEGVMPAVAFSPRKSSSVLYLATKFEGAGELLKKLGKHKLSGSCLHITKLSDVDKSVLEGLVKGTWATRDKK